MHKLVAAVEKHAQRIEKALEFFWKNPETGYREWKGHKYLADAFRELGYELTEAGNIPGFYTDVVTGRPGPMVLVMGEMDSLLCDTHPEADPETGAVHSCGHCCQAAALLGLAAALKEPGVLDELCGTIRLMAVPAEELIEVEYREKLRQEGIIRYYGGKVEFMHRGFMDGVDLAFMIHTTTAPSGSGIITKGSNGCISKEVIYSGVAAHAGGSPDKGINALYAANLTLNAINALRETFRDDDHIRIHPIITHGGTVVNSIPDYVRLESYIRGATLETILAANEKVNRAVAACAAAMGAKVLIKDRPGYSPRVHDLGMMRLAKDAMEEILETSYSETSWGTGCSDLGDVSMVFPAVHPYVGGAVGTEHGNNYYISDVDTACIGSAKVQANMLVKLLEHDAARAWEIKKSFKPTFATMEDFFCCIDGIFMDREAVSYHDDGTVTMSFSNQ
ncbi:MAG: amidohydrolase [Oscillospiraceae bacterium]|nr:amidohydrolase [Oscillospiraceae bacterium]